MADFSFWGLFSTTAKGIPDTTHLPPSTTMKHSYFLYSTLLQATFLLFFVLYFVMSVYRVIKKIKNRSFREVPEEQKEEAQPVKNENENDGKDQQPQTKEENLVYRFDEDQEEDQQDKVENHEGQGKQGEDLKKEDQNQDEKEEKEEKEEGQDYDEYQDASEQPFIKLDQKLVFLQPFFIGFIIANNLFETDLIVLTCLLLMLLCYYLINVKEYLSELRLAPIIFMGFTLVPFVCYFRGDHDFST